MVSGVEIKIFGLAPVHHVPPPKKKTCWGKVLPPKKAGEQKEGYCRHTKLCLVYVGCENVSEQNRRLWDPTYCVTISHMSVATTEAYYTLSSVSFVFPAVPARPRCVELYKCA